MCNASSDKFNMAPAVIIIIIILFVLNQITPHMTANANEQDQKAQRALKMALNA